MTGWLPDGQVVQRGAQDEAVGCPSLRVIALACSIDGGDAGPASGLTDDKEEAGGIGGIQRVPVTARGDAGLGAKLANRATESGRSELKEAKVCSVTGARVQGTLTFGDGEKRGVRDTKDKRTVINRPLHGVFDVRWVRSRAGPTGVWLRGQR
jgi:hypothetical protein